MHCLIRVGCKSIPIHYKPDGFGFLLDFCLGLFFFKKKIKKMKKKMKKRKKKNEKF
jgi:hypothetical protein